ncbi:MAG: crotonase [Desulfatitalea sp.]|nr:enoyl-CoA hydratase/isomerase family protein [Desulfatitalea sp.]NNJ99318.1 crotonase [Desulfatitalea sp.]
MDFEDIKLIKDGPIATLMVDRPKVYNAVRFETMMEIDRAMDDIERDDKIRVIVLTGAGEKAFVSGGDISVMAQGLTYVTTLKDVTRGQDVITRLEYCPKPVIARINGYALGGGTELALGCDIRIASENAVMGQPEIKLGIIPGYGGTQRLPRLVGLGKAKELIMTGDHITAEEALKIGLVNKVVPKDKLDEAVKAMADKLVKGAPVALHMAKAALNNGIQVDLRTALDMEARCYSLCFGTEDRVEGMNAFLEKRAPDFKGR